MSSRSEAIRKPPRRAQNVQSAPYPPPFERAFLRPSWWPTWLGIAFLNLVWRLPRRVRRTLARAAGGLAYRMNAKRRAIVRLNVEWCFPERSAQEREAIARGFFVAMAQAVLDSGLLWWGSEKRIARRVPMEGLEHIERAQAAGENVILLVPHMAGLEFGAQAIGTRFVATGFVKPLRNRLMDWMLGRGRTRFKGAIFPRQQGIRPVIRACRSGQPIYYLADEDLGGTQEVVFAPFFGVPTATLTAIARLARACNARVLPFVTVHDPERDLYQARVYPALEGYPTGDEDADAARVNAVREELIRLAPEQYLWALRLFQTRPDGAPNPYKALNATARRR